VTVYANKIRARQERTKTFGH